MSNQKFTMNDFVEAVNVLFHSQDQEAKKKANQYLLSLDKAQESWDISLQVLSTENLTQEVYFNAINILKNKIIYDFGDYIENKEVIHKLLTFLIDKFDTLKNFPHYIILNYCRCFALGMVFAMDSFQDMMKLCVTKLNVNEDYKNMMCLINIFNYLADATKDIQIVIDENAKDIFCKNLEKIENDVIQYLNLVVKKVINNPNPNEEASQYIKLFSKDILETFTSWLVFGLSKEVITKIIDEYNDLIEFVFKIEQSRLEKHAECICVLLQLPFEEKLVSIIYNKIIMFKDLYYQKKDQCDTEEIQFFVDIFSNLCSNNLDQIFKEKRFDLLQLLVELTEKCPLSRIDYLCDFWIGFYQYTVEKKMQTSEVLKEFKTMFTQMILYMINLTKFDDEIFKLLNVSKTKKLKNNEDYTNTVDYRKILQDFFHEFASEYSFDFFFQDIIFPEFSNTILSIKAKADDISSWSKFESLLFAFSSIAKTINRSSNVELLNTFFNTIFEVPKDFVQIIRTTTDIFDSLGESISQK